MVCGTNPFGLAPVVYIPYLDNIEGIAAKYGFGNLSEQALLGLFSPRCAADSVGCSKHSAESAPGLAVGRQGGEARLSALYPLVCRSGAPKAYARREEAR